MSAIVFHPAAPAGTGGGITSETDPVATGQIAQHKSAVDPHGDRSAAATHADAADAAHAAAVDPHGDRAALTAHTGAADPHGARAYADGRITALVNAAPAALDTLAEIDAQLSSDETGAAAMQAAINARALTTDLTAHINDADAAHAASAVSVNPSGLVVVTSTNVQAALAQIDAWTQARPTNEDGLAAALPPNGTRPNGSTYFATDLNGGTTYRMVAGVWRQQAPGVNAPAGQELDYSTLQGASFTPTNDNTWQTITGIQVTVPANRPCYITAKMLFMLKIGGIALNTDIACTVRLIDQAITGAIDADNWRVPGTGAAAGANNYYNRTVVLGTKVTVAVATTYICQVQVPAVVPAGQASIYSGAPYHREMRVVAA